MKSIQIKRSITDRNNISLNDYLKDISKIKMLTPEQEKEVGKLAKAGDRKDSKELPHGVGATASEPANFAIFGLCRIPSFGAESDDNGRLDCSLGRPDIATEEEYSGREWYRIAPRGH